MQGHPDVINYLVTLLKGELAARDQYFIHSRMYEDWGLSKLFERINHEMEEETQHADALMRRILMLEGTPDMRADDLEVGSTVPEMIEADLKLEYKVRAALCKGIELCELHYMNQILDFNAVDRTVVCQPGSSLASCRPAPKNTAFITRWTSPPAAPARLAATSAPMPVGSR